MESLLIGLKARLDLTSLDEWTIEVNPATASLPYLQMLHSHGVNRISMGAQSFDPAELKMLERRHDPGDVERSVQLCRDAAFERLNVDLIYAIPGQTREGFDRSLRRALDLNLEHYSAYNLTYEPNTPMAVKQRLGQIETIDESTELSMLNDARCTMATAGRAAYEVSNYAAPGAACRHNLCYWTGQSYLGLGPSAASHIEGVRFKNQPHIGVWENAIERGELPAIDVERLSMRQREGEFVMLGLRLAAGVSDLDFADRFNRSLNHAFRETIERISRMNLIEQADGRLRLTAAGLPVADAIAAEFLDAAAD